MKTYQQLMNEIAPTGGQVTVSKRFGRGVGSGDTRAGAGVSFSNKIGTRQGNLNVDIGRTTKSGGGDKISQGISKAIEKPGVPSSTSSAPKSRITANVSGNLTARSAPDKPEPPKPKKEKIKNSQKEKQLKQPKQPKQPNNKNRSPEIARRPKPSNIEDPSNSRYNKAKARLQNQGLADAGGNAYTGSSKHVDRMTQSTDAKTRDLGGQAFKDMKLVGDVNRSSREKMSTGVNRGKMVQRDGQWMKVFN